MKILPYLTLTAIFASGWVSAEVCIENDTSIPEAAFSFGFTASLNIDRSRPAHPVLITTESPLFLKLAQRDDDCVTFADSPTPGTPGYLLVYIRPPATAQNAYRGDSVVYVSKHPVSASASSTQLLAVEGGNNGVVIVKSTLDQKPIKRLAMEKVYVITPK